MLPDPRAWRYRRSLASRVALLATMWFYPEELLSVLAVVG